MIEINDQEYYDEVRAFAERAGKLEQLKEKLAYLDTYAEHGDRGKTKCILYKDFAPYSFQFTMQERNELGEYQHWFIGGLVFHGDHDGYGSGSAPTLSVCVNPTDGWSVHT